MHKDHQGEKREHEIDQIQQAGDAEGATQLVEYQADGMQKNANGHLKCSVGNA
jgi:hypothetical protein